MKPSASILKRLIWNSVFILALLSLGACKVLSINVNPSEHPYIPWAADLGEFYQIDISQGKEESYVINVPGDYLVEYGYHSQYAHPDSFFLEYSFLLEVSNSSMGAIAYMEENIEILEGTFDHATWEPKKLYKIDLGQDEYHALEYYEGDQIVGSFAIMRFGHIVITLRINSNPDNLPGLYQEFLRPYVQMILENFALAK